MYAYAPRLDTIPVRQIKDNAYLHLDTIYSGTASKASCTRVYNSRHHFWGRGINAPWTKGLFRVSIDARSAVLTSIFRAYEKCIQIGIDR